jgi:chromosome segregation ATPase
MKPSLDRRLEQFQAKVQQRVTLADDEIARCQEYLDQLRVKINDVEDQNRRVQLQLQQRSDEKGGSKKRRIAANQAEAASLKRDHQVQLTELLTRFQSEDDSLRSDFDSQLAEMERYVQGRAEEKVGPVQEKMAKMAVVIKQLREKVEKANQDTDPSAQIDIQATLRAEDDRISSLEAQARERNADRLNSLVQARAKLAQCVQTLEEMEEKHRSDIADLKQKLNVQDRKYRDKLKVVTENHARQKESLQLKVEEMETRAGQAQKALKRAERHFTREMGLIGAENEQLQTEFTEVTTKQASRRLEEAELEQAEVKMEQLRAEVQRREDLLLKLRAQTQMARRELARVRHEAALAKRRAALDLV